MTQEFRSLAAFAEKLLVLEVVVQRELHTALDRVGGKVEGTAKKAIGEYQDAVGPFPGWAPLAESTVEDRVRKGYAPDEPLLRTGELRESISHEVHGLEVAIGSTSEIAVYQELGTARGVPPRPFLGPAIIHNEKAIEEILGHAVVRAIAGGSELQRIEYSAEIGDEK